MCLSPATQQCVLRIAHALASSQAPCPAAAAAAFQDLASFADEIAAYHAAQTPIAAEAAQRAKQQAKEARAARDAPGGADSECLASDSAARVSARHTVCLSSSCMAWMCVLGSALRCTLWPSVAERVLLSCCAAAAAAVAAAAAAAAALATGERGAGSRKFEATPDFVAGGALHPYQLEGLNWLYHKAQVRGRGKGRRGQQVCAVVLRNAYTRAGQLPATRAPEVLKAAATLCRRCKLLLFRRAVACLMCSGVWCCGGHAVLVW